MGAKQGDRSPRLGLTKQRRTAAICAYRESGLYARAAEAAKVDDSTVRYWRSNHPDFQAELDEAGEEFNTLVYQLARSKLREHLQSAGDTYTLTHEELDRSGDIHVLSREEKVHLNPALARTALAKGDPAWTHPKQEVEHSGSMTVQESVAAAAARLEANGGSTES